MVGVGIDVCKAWLDVCVWGVGGTRRYSNDARGREALLADLARCLQARVVIEATGGYEMPLLDALSHAGIWVSRVNPRHARDFAKALGYLAKTDALDAAVLAEMAHKLHDRLRVYTPSEPWRAELAQWFKRRAHVVQQIIQQRQQLASYTIKSLRRMVQQELLRLQRQLKGLDQQLERLAREYVTPALSSQKGVGAVAQLAILAQLPELGRLRVGKSPSWLAWRR